MAADRFSAAAAEEYEVAQGAAAPGAIRCGQVRRLSCWHRQLAATVSCNTAGRPCLFRRQGDDLLLEQAKKLRKLLQWAEMKCLMVEGEWQKRVA